MRTLERALNRVERDDEGPLTASAGQDTLHTAQSTRTNAYALTNFKKRMGAERQLLFGENLDGLNLLVWNRNAHSVRTNETQHAVDPQHLQTLAIIGQSSRRHSR